MAEVGLIYSLIPAVMAEIGAIAKGRKNQQQGYMFRGIDDVFMAAQAVFAKHGIFIATKVVKMDRAERTTQRGNTLIYTILTVEHTFYAKDGSSVVVTTMGEAMDSGDKSCNKAMSAALKYAVLQTFVIPTEEPKDTENESHEVLPENPPPKPLPPFDPVRAQQAINDAMKARHIPTADADGIVQKWITEHKFADIAAAGRENCKLFIEEIKSGKHDLI